MQTQLPIFPEATQLFNPTCGVFKQKDIVYYLHNGSPLFCHHTKDRNSYRYITANLVVTRLCSASEIARVLGVSTRSIQLNAKALRDKGAFWFFKRVETRGKCYKFNAEVFEEAQKKLDEGKAPSQTARELGVSESAIRYHVKRGRLKKNPNKRSQVTE